MIATPLLLLSSLLLFCPSALGKAEGDVAEACTEGALMFGCKHRDEELAILEAWLYGSTARRVLDKGRGQQCYVPEYMVSYIRGSFLQYINKQCAGQRSCVFNVTDHVPNAKQDPEEWQGGVLRAAYQCVKKSQVNRVCGSEVKGQSGWIQNVGYPEYYLGGSGPCTITVTVDEGQRVQLTLVDLSIRDVFQPDEVQCRDSLAVGEGTKSLTLLSAGQGTKGGLCGTINQPVSVTSEGPSITITLTASMELYTKRGYSIYFEALGCESPATPQDGYRSFRNATHAEYWCCVHHVFPDTLARRRVLGCLRGRFWNDTVPDCIELDELLHTGNISETQYIGLVNGSANGAYAEMYREAHLVYDLVVPTVIMSILVIGNVAVVVLIIYCRRGIMDDSSRSEELESIKANPEPTDTLDSAPCSV